MIVAIADNICSPLGVTSEQNFEAVLRGDSALSLHARVHGEELVEPFVGSVFPSLPLLDGFTPFESLCIASAEQAIASAASSQGFDSAAPDCVFILSTTKGNIWSSPAESARRIALHFGNHTAPVVISTACTSGVSAQVIAWRLLSAGLYRTAVLIGCDVQCRFIVSGFQSFKALSDEPCRPFDAARKGLNAGEAAATLILQRIDAIPASPESPENPEHPENSAPWVLLSGSIHNDANHISGPSRTAEGSLRCLQDMLAVLPATELSFVSVHGTATAYNDEMESIALYRAGLSSVPVSALKGNYGHTMGAAGLLETILSMKAVEHGLVLPAKGYASQGTTYAVNLSGEARPSSRRSFVKLLSGFGGVNAAVAWTSGLQVMQKCRSAEIPDSDNYLCKSAKVQKSLSVLSDVTLSSPADLAAIYRAEVGDYPKFFKMDQLSRLGFLAVERLLRDHHDQLDSERTAVILANHTSSLKNDTDYQATIADSSDYYPSPALFVYTLPNIVTGELAIRHHLFGETAFYILEQESDLRPIVEASFAAGRFDNAIVGWLESPAKDVFCAHLQFLSAK